MSTQHSIKIKQFSVYAKQVDTFIFEKLPLKIIKYNIFHNVFEILGVSILKRQKTL